MLTFIILWSFILFCPSSSNELINANNTNQIVDFGPKRVFRFSGLGSQEVLHWTLVDFYDELVVRFSGTVNETGGGISTGCADTNVTLVVRQAAIPISNPKNAIIPDRTFVQSDGLLFSGNFILSASTQGQEHDVIVSPNVNQPEHYFAALFLPDTDEKIDVAGLTKECHYYSKLKVFSNNSSAPSATVAEFVELLQHTPYANAREQLTKPKNLYTGMKIIMIITCDEQLARQLNHGIERSYSSRDQCDAYQTAC